MLKSGPDLSQSSGAKDLLSSWLAQRPDLDLHEFLMGIVLNRVGRMLEGSFDRMCRSKFGFSGPDMRVLFALRRHGAPYALRPTDLSRALLVTSGAITKQVDRLQAIGLVERLPDPEYAGGFQIQLTGAGLEVANAATEALVDDSLLGNALKLMPPDMVGPGEVFMYRLLEALEEAARADHPRPVGA